MDRGEHVLDGLGLALSTQHGGLLVALGAENLCLPRTFGLKDRGLLGALSGEDRGTAVALRAHLLLHGVLDRQGRIDGFQLDASDANAPFSGGFVEDDAQLPVDVVAAGEGFFEVQTTDDVAQGGRGQLFDGAEVVRDLVRRCPCVGHLEVDDRVDRDDEVVLGDHRLRREGDDLLAHVDQRSQSVDEGHEDIQAGSERLVVAAETLDHTGGGLRNDADRSGHRHHHEDDDRDGEDPADGGGDERGVVHGFS